MWKIKGLFAELKTSLKVFRKICLTLASFKSRKSHDNDVTFYPLKNYITKNCIFALDKTFLLSSCEYFCNKFKTEAFYRYCEELYKTELLNKPNCFRTVGAPKCLEGIAKLDTIREQFAQQIFNRFL